MTVSYRNRYTKKMGVTDGSSAGAGEIGETVTATGAQTVYSGDLTTVNAASIVLQPGDWDVTGLIDVDTSTAATIDLISLALNTTSAALGGAGLISNIIAQSCEADGTRLYDVGRSSYSTFVTGRISVSVPTTVYLTTRAGFLTGTPRYLGTIRARRAR